MISLNDERIRRGLIAVAQDMLMAQVDMDRGTPESGARMLRAVERAQAELSWLYDLITKPGPSERR